MSYLIAVDPGLHACGVAIFTDSVLQDASYIQSDSKYTALNMIAQSMVYSVLAKTGRMYGNMVIELPQVYPVSKGDPNDLISLAVVIGALVEGFGGHYTQLVKPREWGGQTPKKTKNQRVLKALRESEKAKIVSVGAKDHNTLDAIGIGLWKLGRYK